MDLAGEIYKEFGVATGFFVFLPRKFCGVIFDQKNMYFEGELVILIIQIRNFDEKLALSGQTDQIDGQNTAFFDQK